MKKIIFLSAFALTFLILLFTGCTKDPAPILVNTNCNNPNSSQDSGFTESNIGVPSYSINEEHYCEEQEKKITIIADVLANDIIQSSESAVGMTYSHDNLKNPLRMRDNYEYQISANIPGINSVEVKEPTIVGVSDARSSLFNQLGDNRYSPVFEFSDAFFASTDIQAMIRVSASAKALFGGVDYRGFFEVEGGYNGVNYYIVKGQQTFSVFTDLDKEAIEKSLDANSVPDGVCPVMIKGETWGKLHVMRFSSQDVSISLKAEYETAVNTLIASGKGALSTQQKLLMQKAKMQTLTLGGVDPYKISETIPALDGGIALPDFTVKGSTWGKNNPGVPLGFHYTFLDGTPYKTTTTTRYTEINCQLGSPLFNDTRTVNCGSYPGGAPECEVLLEDNEVLTGIAVRVSKGDVPYLQLQYRTLSFNGELGNRSTRLCNNRGDTPAFEMIWEAPDNRVITNIGLSESDDDVNVLKVTYAEPYNDNGKIKLRKSKTITVGDKNYGVEAYCEPLTDQQIIRGVGIKANSKRIDMLRLYLGIIEY